MNTDYLRFVTQFSGLTEEELQDDAAFKAAMIRLGGHIQEKFQFVVSSLEEENWKEYEDRTVYFEGNASDVYGVILRDAYDPTEWWMRQKGYVPLGIYVVEEGGMKVYPVLVSLEEVNLHLDLSSL